MQKWLAILCWLSVVFPAAADERELRELFSERQVQGTLMLSSLKGEQTFIHNEQRAGQRFTPASTFKILNTLIAVQQGAVSGPDFLFKWSGEHYDFSAWNRDLTLRDAFQVSCVWCYQRLASKIGSEVYRQSLRSLHYGRLQEPFKTTTFWLDGALKVSAREQVAFLKAVFRQDLPFSRQAYSTLKSVMLVEKTPAYTLEAKSGWSNHIGWYIGYVETRDDVWFFALNMDVRDSKRLPLRKSLVLEALKLKEIL
ncbi:class D beta-lactamase [Thiomicrorhabdus sp.]|uniref:class D beta-lactamase n=1 Tax=Thiomicrorhabdus sp. TaxID=2039724 RepID=UPI0029C81886|nr:class D beta-lactamase [Thiomicrorhabdus sp.]